MTDRDIFVSIGANIGAGSDTTSITLSAILYHLMKNPETMRRLREELDEASREGRISDPITFKEAQELPYLQAVIKEGLRIHPATGFTMPRVVPKGGKEIMGRFFPGGVSLCQTPESALDGWMKRANCNRLLWESTLGSLIETPKSLGTTQISSGQSVGWKIKKLQVDVMHTSFR